MDLFGIIGNPVAHSLSGKYFNDKFTLLGIEARYELFRLRSIDELPDLLSRNPGIRGLNVTHPFKLDVLPFCDELDQSAAVIRAANTLKIIRTGSNPRIKGYNTDADGFAAALIQISGNNLPAAMILGSGGAARAVAYALTRLGGTFILVSRNPKKGMIAYHDITHETVIKYPLVINTTPLGMGILKDRCPEFPYGQLSRDHLLFDLNYNPPETEFLRRGRLAGARTSNGLVMLQAQAEKSWELWQNDDA